MQVGETSSDNSSSEGENYIDYYLIKNMVNKVQDRMNSSMIE